MRTRLLLTFCIFPFFIPLVSCERKGPVEKTGEQIDKAAEKVKDAVDPKGPAEKTGEKIDKALGK